MKNYLQSVGTLIFLLFSGLSCSRESHYEEKIDPKEEEINVINRAMDFSNKKSKTFQFLSFQKTRASNNDVLHPTWEQASVYSFDDLSSIEIPIEDYEEKRIKIRKIVDSVEVENTTLPSTTRLVVCENKENKTLCHYLITKIWTGKIPNMNDSSIGTFIGDALTFIYDSDGKLISSFQIIDGTFYFLEKVDDNSEYYCYYEIEFNGETHKFIAFNHKSKTRSGGWGDVGDVIIVGYDRITDLYYETIFNILATEWANVHYGGSYFPHNFYDPFGKYASGCGGIYYRVLDLFITRLNHIVFRSFNPPSKVTSKFDIYKIFESNGFSIETLTSGYNCLKITGPGLANFIWRDFCKHSGITNPETPPINPGGGSGGGGSHNKPGCNDERCLACGKCLNPSSPDCEECTCNCTDKKCPICGKCFYDGGEKNPNCIYCESSEKDLHLLQDSILKKCPFASKIFYVRDRFLSVRLFYKWESADMATDRVLRSDIGARICNSIAKFNFYELPNGACVSGDQLALPTNLLLNRNNNLLATILLHELFHTKQSFTESSRANAEVEAKLAKIYFARHIGVDPASVNQDDQLFFQNLLILQSYLDPYGNLIGMRYSDFNELFKELAKRLGTQASYGYDETLTLEQNTKTLKQYLQ